MSFVLCHSCIEVFCFFYHQPHLFFVLVSGFIWNSSHKIIIGIFCSSVILKNECYFLYTIKMKVDSKCLHIHFAVIFCKTDLVHCCIALWGLSTYCTIYSIFLVILFNNIYCTSLPSFDVIYSVWLNVCMYCIFSYGISSVVWSLVHRCTIKK